MSVALFFVMAAGVFSLILPTDKGFAGIFGGPKGQIINITEGKNDFALLYAVPNPAGNVQISSPKTKSFEAEYLLSDSVNGPNLNPSAGGYMDYKVSEGDTLSKIAKSFGISIETISAANPKVRGRSLKIGETLKILPITGFVYSIKEGETAESVASKYGLSIAQLLSFNPGINLSASGVGSSFVIPGNPRGTEDSVLPELKSYFALPAKGLNWGNLHNYNAVDIANVCGIDVLSAADGLVTDIGQESENNNGYGGYVLIEHSNGTKTRYAHLGKINVDLGNYVKQNIKIGEMGNTGTVHGPSGCHLHFEVYGAQNPFRKS